MFTLQMFNLIWRENCSTPIQFHQGKYKKIDKSLELVTRFHGNIINVATLFQNIEGISSQNLVVS